MYICDRDPNVGEPLPYTDSIGLTVSTATYYTVAMFSLRFEAYLQQRREQKMPKKQPGALK